MERVDISPDGADIRLRTAGLAKLVEDRGATKFGSLSVSTERRCRWTDRHRPSFDFDPQTWRPKACYRPDGTTDTWAVPSRRIDNAMVKAIARAFRWREMLESRTYATIAEIAVAEKINESYAPRFAPHPAGPRYR